MIQKVWQVLIDGDVEEEFNTQAEAEAEVRELLAIDWNDVSKIGVEYDAEIQEWLVYEEDNIYESCDTEVEAVAVAGALIEERKTENAVEAARVAVRLDRG